MAPHAGKLNTALSAFSSLQAAARKEGRADLVLELHKWLGHTHTKLGNFTEAADAFNAGIEAAKVCGVAALSSRSTGGGEGRWGLEGEGDGVGGRGSGNGDGH